MKFIIVTSLILASHLSFAATCFKAFDQVSPKSNLPETVCVFSYKLNLITPPLPDLPHYQAIMVTDKGTFTNKKVEFSKAKEAFNVTVTKVLAHEYNGACASSYKSALTFEFKVDAQSKVIENKLMVTGVEISNFDTCHSTDEKTVVRYKVK